MTVDRAANQRRKFRDLGVVELKDPSSAGRRRELIAKVMGTMEEVKHGSGQVIIAGGITRRQEGHLMVHIKKHHRGLKERIEIDRSFPYHDGQRLARGIMFKINDRASTKAG